MVTSLGLNMTVPTTQSVSQIQHSVEHRGQLNNELATQQANKEIKQHHETVIQKDDAAFYQPNHDAKEESKNKYYEKNKKKNSSEDPKQEETPNSNRMNFDIKI